MASTTNSSTTTPSSSTPGVAVAKSAFKKNVTVIEIEIDDESAQETKHHIAEIKRTRTNVSINNTDKPALLAQQINADLVTQIKKDQQNALHGFHANGRDLEQLAIYSKNVLINSANILLVAQPDFSKYQADAKDHKKIALAMYMIADWCKTVYKFSQEEELPAGHIIFIRDTVRPEYVYLPCCNDVKQLTNKMLRTHYLTCVVDRALGVCCSFCNNTNADTGSFKDVKLLGEHYLQDTHLNALYQGLVMTDDGFRMADLRTVDLFVTNRPAINYFLTGTAGQSTRANLLAFLKTHVFAQKIENTPFYCGFTKMIRMAKNKGKASFGMSCLECDTAYSTFSMFYLGPLLGGEEEECICGGNGHRVQVVKVEKLLAEVAALSKKNEKISAADLDELFAQIKTKGNVDALRSDFDVDALVNGTLGVVTVVVGNTTASAGVTSTVKTRSRKITTTPPSSGRASPVVQKSPANSRRSSTSSTDSYASPNRSRTPSPMDSKKAKDAVPVAITMTAINNALLATGATPVITAPIPQIVYHRVEETAQQAMDRLHRSYIDEYRQGRVDYLSTMNFLTNYDPNVGSQTESTMRLIIRLDNEQHKNDPGFKIRDPDTIIEAVKGRAKRAKT